MVFNRQPDVIIAGLDRQPFLDQMAGQKPDCIGINCYAADLPDPWLSITPDWDSVAALALDHLLRNGHRNIGMLWVGHHQWPDHLRRSMEELGVEHDITVLQHAVAGTQQFAWHVSVLEWLRDQQTPMAVVIEPLLATAVIQAARERPAYARGSRHPLCLDEDELTATTYHRELTTIELPGVAIGRHCARIIGGLVEQRHHSFPPNDLLAAQSTELTAVEDPVVAHALAIIKREFHQPLRITDLLRSLNISRRSLEQHFQRQLGRSPLAELQRVRLDHARSLLQQTSLSIEDIARRCGYNSATHFGRIFRQHTGVSGFALASTTFL